MKYSKKLVLLVVSIIIITSVSNFAFTADKTETDSIKNKTHHMMNHDGTTQHKEHSQKSDIKKTEAQSHRYKDVDIKAADACCSTKLIWNEVCPVMGNEIDPEANTVEYNGKLYGFCCDGCDSKFRTNPEKYSKNLSEDGKSFIGIKEKH